jgi:mRNA interferase MazF
MRRGDVFQLSPPSRRGHEQRGTRFGIVVQSDAFLPRSVVIVAPTSRSARSASFRPEVVLEDETTKALVEQIGAVDVTRLGELVGHLTAQEMWGVDQALRTVLSLD